MASKKRVKTSTKPLQFNINLNFPAGDPVGDAFRAYCEDNDAVPSIVAKDFIVKYLEEACGHKIRQKEKAPRIRSSQTICLGKPDSIEVRAFERERALNGATKAEGARIATQWVLTREGYLDNGLNFIRGKHGRKTEHGTGRVKEET